MKETRYQTDISPTNKPEMVGFAMCIAILLVESQQKMDVIWVWENENTSYAG
jgi:hypothetical protein